MNPGFTVKFWGVRGTVPCPGPETVVFGGNTACVEVRCGDQLLIFDAGSGLRPLGKALLRTQPRVRAHLFLSHTHLDHILGLPFFKPAYDEGNQFELWNGHLRRQHKTLKQVLCRIMEKPYFPVPMDVMHAALIYRDFDAGEAFRIGEDIKISTTELIHPGGATGYRVEFAGRSFCYITDTEHTEGKLDQNILHLIEGGDIVVYDATYTEPEYERFKRWGHSTWQQGVRLCEAAKAGRLVAFHHDPAHDDKSLSEIDAALQRAWPGSFVAREGQLLELA